MSRFGLLGVSQSTKISSRPLRVFFIVFKLSILDVKFYILLENVVIGRNKLNWNVYVTTSGYEITIRRSLP